MTSYAENFSGTLNAFQIYGVADATISSGQLAKAGTGETRFRRKPSSWLPEEDQKVRLKYTTSSTLVGRYAIYLKSDALDPLTCDRARCIVDIGAGTISADVLIGGVGDFLLTSHSIGAHNTSAAHWLEFEFADNQWRVAWGKLDPASNAWTYDSGLAATEPAGSPGSGRFLGRYGRYSAGHVGLMFNPGSASHRIDDFTLVDADNPLNPYPVLGGSADYSTSPVPYNVDDGWPSDDYRTSSDANIWNTPLPALSDRREHPDSTSIITAILDQAEADGGGGDPDLRGPANIIANQLSGDDFAHPIYYAQAGDEEWELFPEAPPTGYWLPDEWPYTGEVILIPADAEPADGGDRHMTIVQPDGTAWDFYKATKGGGNVLTVRNGGNTPIYGTDSHVSFGAVASENLSIAGNIWPGELEAGVIPHALAVIVDGVETPPVYPGFHSAKRKQDVVPPITDDRLHTGARIYLDYTDGEIVGLGLPTWQEGIIKALRDYGGIVTDTSGVALGVGSPLSPLTWQSFGYDNPYETLGRNLYNLATASVILDGSGRYVFVMRNNVDWDGHLKVLDAMEGQKNP